MPIIAALLLVGTHASATNFLSPRIAVLHREQICWRLPSGTRVQFEKQRGKNIPYVLSRVKMEDGSRRNLGGLFSFWSKDALLRTGMTASRLREVKASPQTLDGMLYAGHGEFMIVSGAHNTRTELEALERLYRGISLRP